MQPGFPYHSSRTWQDDMWRLHGVHVASFLCAAGAVGATFVLLIE